MSGTEQTIRVAVIEDDRAYREGLVFLLNATIGLTCVGDFPNASEAAKYSNPEKPDVVLLDLDLGTGQQDGNASLPVLRRSFPQAKFLVLTALYQPERVFEAVRRGAAGYLRKTCSFDELPSAIRDVHSGSARLSPELFQLIYDALQNPVPRSDEWTKLSAREREVLELLALGYNPKDVSARLAITYDTFKTHCKNFQEKLEVPGTSGAIRKVFPKKRFSLLPRWLSGGNAVE